MEKGTLQNDVLNFYLQRRADRKAMNLSFKCFLQLMLFMTVLSANHTTASQFNEYLPTVDGLSVKVSANFVDDPVATVIYITGLGGTSNNLQKLSSDFSDRNLNFVTFDRDEPPCNGFECFSTVGRRVPSGQPIYAEDQPSALDHIVANEVKTIFDFVTQQNWYQNAPKLYLIAGSYGAWIALQASVTPELGNLINGAVFVSPSVVPHKSSGKYANEKIRFDAIKTGFNGKPVLAIGSRNDILFPGATTADSLDLLKQALTSADIQTIYEPTGKHAKELLINDAGRLQQVIDWIVSQAISN